jgi:ribonuclease P protein component
LERGVLARQEQARHRRQQVAIETAKLGRLRASADFARVRAEGGFRRGRFCSLNAARRPTEEVPDEPTRVGFIASKRLGSAVRRNRARRLMRESIRLLAAGIGPNWDVVLIAQRDLCLPGTRRQAVQEEVLWLLTKAHIVRPAPTDPATPR